MVKNVLLFALILIWSVSTQGVQTPGNQGPPTQNPPKTQTLFFKTATDISGTVQALSDQGARSEMNSQIITSPLGINLYSFANLAFNLQYYFPYCKRCQVIQYFAFRYGNYYLTARNTYLDLEFNINSSPTNAQLFIGQQQIDGTWAFRSLTQNKYIRAQNDGTTIDYQYFVGPWERWWIERHGNHVHIQSAQFQYNWWIFDNFVLQQLNGGASPVIMEYYPKLQWLWNW